MVLKKQKLLNRSAQNCNNNDMGVMGEDRISKLPDPLLNHILSFLPTKCAVSTSVLSKRWRNVWIFTPVLDFRKWWTETSYCHDDDYPWQAEIFTEFMDKMLSIHDNMPNIQKFYLFVDENFDESKVHEWISAIVKRKVEEINLCLFAVDEEEPSEDDLFSDEYYTGADFTKERFTLPTCLFTCESLTTLELDVFTNIEPPESIFLPRLKTLRLTSIRFVDEKLTQQFFSNCPILEELILDSCSSEDMNVVSISVPPLKRLSVIGYNKGNCELHIHAPSLLSFKYIGKMDKNYDHLHSFSALVDADVGFFTVYFKMVSEIREKRDEIGYDATKFMEGLSNVKRLKLCRGIFEALSYADDLLTKLPTFNNLIHLEVTSSFPCWMSGTLVDFLHISPNLESIIFAEGIVMRQSEKDDGWIINLVPQCLLLHLKSVEFRGSYGGSGAVNAIKLFLKNARFLRSMTFVSPKNSYGGSTYQSGKLKEEILNFPRASSCCEIKFT